MKVKRRAMRKQLPKRHISVAFNVKDSTQEEFLNDLSEKVIDVIRNRLAPVLVQHSAAITGNLVRTYLVTQGLLTAAGEETTQAYFIRAAITLDVLNAILQESGIDLEADIIPRSITAEEYKKLFAQKDTTDETKE